MGKTTMTEQLLYTTRRDSMEGRGLDPVQLATNPKEGQSGVLINLESRRPAVRSTTSQHDCERRYNIVMEPV